MSQSEGPGFFATRAYYLAGHDSDSADLTIAVGRPYLYQPGFYRCEYQVAMKNDTISGYIDGIDEIDSLLAALRLVGSSVSGLNESVYCGRLCWEGGSGVGLPTV